MLSQVFDFYNTRFTVGFVFYIETHFSLSRSSLNSNTHATTWYIFTYLRILPLVFDLFKYVFYSQIDFHLQYAFSVKYYQ